MKHNGFWAKLPIILMALTLVVVLVERLFPKDDATAFKLGNIVLLALSFGIIGSFIILLLRQWVIILSVRLHKTLADGVITMWQHITQSRWTFKAKLAIKIVAILIAVFLIFVSGHRLGLFQLPYVEELPSALVAKGKPDLSITQILLPESALPGETIYFSFQIENQGTRSSGTFNIRVFFGTAPYATDRPLGNFTLDSLSVASSSILSVYDLPIPSSTIPGTYLITVFADSERTVDEYDENNNILVWQLYKFSRDCLRRYHLGLTLF